MSCGDSLENRKAIAYRRNAYKREWPGFEHALQQLGLHARYRPLSTEESLDTEKRMREEVTVAPQTGMNESQKAHSTEDLEPSLGRFLSAVGERPLVVWLLNSSDLLFEAMGLTVNDITKLIQYDGDTVVVSRSDFSYWLVLDDNDDEIYGRFFEITVKLGGRQFSSDE